MKSIYVLLAVIIVGCTNRPKVAESMDFATRITDTLYDIVILHDTVWLHDSLIAYKPADATKKQYVFSDGWDIQNENVPDWEKHSLWEEYYIPDSLTLIDFRKQLDSLLRKMILSDTMKGGKSIVYPANEGVIWTEKDQTELELDSARVSRLRNLMDSLKKCCSIFIDTTKH